MAQLIFDALIDLNRFVRNLSDTFPPTQLVKRFLSTNLIHMFTIDQNKTKNSPIISWLCGVCKYIPTRHVNQKTIVYIQVILCRCNI